MQQYSNLKWQDEQISVPRYSARKTTENDKELSPWNNDQFKRMFAPQQYYQTITNSQKKQQRRQYQQSKSLSQSRDQSHTLNGRISKDFMHLVKLQKKGAYLQSEDRRTEEHHLKMNLVNVNLEQIVMREPEKRYGLTIGNFYQSRRPNSMEIHKEQPVKVRMFKKILEKNKQTDGYAEKTMQFTEAYQLPELRTEGSNLYQGMPRRTPKLNQERKKVQSSIEAALYDGFPKLAFEKNRSCEEKDDFYESGFFCKGEIIASKDIQSKRKMKYRQFQLQDSSKTPQEPILFLQQFSAQK